MSRKFNDLTYDDLNRLTNIITNYEKFALVTFEPYMISIIEHNLFFKVIVPLHRSGAFSKFITDIIKKVKKFFYYIFG